MMETIELSNAHSVAIAIARYGISRELTSIVQERSPNLRRFVSLETEEDMKKFEEVGITAVVTHSFPKGIDMAAAVLKDLGVGGNKIQGWMQRIQNRALITGEKDEILISAA